MRLHDSWSWASWFYLNKADIPHNNSKRNTISFIKSAFALDVFHHYSSNTEPLVLRVLTLTWFWSRTNLHDNQYTLTKELITFEQSWQKKLHHAVYLDTPFIS